MELSKIRAAGKAILEGQWVDVPQIPGVKFLVRGASHPEVRRYGAKMFSALPREMREDPEEMEKIERAQARDAILLNWEGLQDGGAALACTAETKATAFADPELAVVFTEAVSAASAKVGKIEAEAEKADAKN
jgi:hypothetical protein